MEENKQKKGFTQENVKRLFKVERGDLYWVVFLILLVLMSYFYYRDITPCREFMKEPYDRCLQIVSEIDTQRMKQENWTQFYEFSGVINRTLNEEG